MNHWPHACRMHDDVIKWKHFLRCWTFVRGIHRSPVNSPQKGQWRGALMFSLICVWINDWVNDREAGDLKRYRANFDVTVMVWINIILQALYKCLMRTLDGDDDNPHSSITQYEGRLSRLKVPIVKIKRFRITTVLSWYQFYIETEPSWTHLTQIFKLFHP